MDLNLPVIEYSSLQGTSMHSSPVHILRKDLKFSGVISCCELHQKVDSESIQEYINAMELNR
jgi:hypothetical protein